jgi:hypothetical protein
MKLIKRLSGLGRGVLALRLGFAHLDEKDMCDAVSLLHEAYQETVGAK